VSQVVSQPPNQDVDARGSQGVQSGDHNIQFNLFAESSSVVWPLQVGAVPLLADCFQERETYSDRLDQVVTTGGTAVMTQVLSGLGGIGKTQLAAACAQRVWRDHGVELLVWATAGSRETIQATYAQAGTEIGQSPPAGVEQASEWFLGWLQTTTRPWMIVLDDLQDPADLQGLWPDGPAGRVLVTTRRRDTVLSDRGRQLIEVGLYTPAEAVAYLQERIATGDGGRLDEAAELAADLGDLPLALAQAAAFIRDRHETCTGYRRRLRDRRRRLCDILPADALADDYRSTVAATWSISAELADRLVPLGLARPTLQLASGLDPNGAPIEVFTAPTALAYLTRRRDASLDDEHDAQVEEPDCRDALSNLHRLNLVSIDPAGGARAVRTHALVQRATLEHLAAEILADTVWAVADTLVQVWPAVERDTDLGRVLRDCTASLTERHGPLLWVPDVHPLLFRSGRSLGECGLVHAATSYLAEMRSTAVDVLGSDHPDTLTTRSNLAGWLGEAGDLTGAVTAFEQLLTDRLRVLGPDHPDTLTTRGNLAFWRAKAGDPTGAVTAFEQLLTDCLRVLGPDHRHIFAIRENLAVWRGQAGDATGALTAFEQLLTDRLRVLGPDHPDTLTTRSNLAFWLGEAGDATGALTAFEQLLTDRLRVLGPDHPQTLTTRGNLAFWLGEAGDATGAATATAFEQLLTTDSLRVLGPDHPQTLNIRHNLIRRRGQAGDATGAATATEQLLTDYLRVLGPDHPDTLTTRSNLAFWRGHAGDPAGAVTAFEQLLTDYLRVLGPDHPHTLTAWDNLAYFRSKVEVQTDQ